MENRSQSAPVHCNSIDSVFCSDSANIKQKKIHVFTIWADKHALNQYNWKP